MTDEEHAQSIDRAIAYLGSLDPGFAARIAGAGADEIDALERASGRPLHPAHRRFLERLGSGAGIDLGAVDARVPKLLEYYQGTSGALTPGYHLFAVGAEDPYEDAFLVEREGGELAVMLTDSLYGGDLATLDPGELTRVAGSLAELLCLPPFVRHVFEPKAHKATLTNREIRPGAMARFDTLAADEGWTPLWFSSPMTRVLSAGGSAIIAKQVDGEPLAVAFASDSRVEHAALHWWLTRRVGLDADLA